MPLTTVFLGLGSNVDRHRHLCAGLDALAAFLVDLRCSPVFESEPVGIRSGPFYNLAVLAQTDLPLAELDRRLKAIEADNGRYAPDRKGLPLDIDVLLYDDLIGDFEVRRQDALFSHIMQPVLQDYLIRREQEKKRARDRAQGKKKDKEND